MIAAAFGNNMLEKNRKLFDSVKVHDQRSFLALDVEVTQNLGGRHEQILLLLGADCGNT